LGIGAHTSIAKSLENAALTAARIGGNTFQIFSASPRKARLYPLVIHDNYLINLVSCSETLRAQSSAAFRGDIERAGHSV
jgi:deoxyribonuclease-4